MSEKTEANVRKFDTGATRDTEEGKIDYEGFLSPTALARFGQYMHKHRHQSDGSLRDSDNWQKGIPIPVYVKSLIRHVVAVWTLFRSGDNLSDEQEDSLCAVLFNSWGMLHENLKARKMVDKPVGKPAPVYPRYFLDSDDVRFRGKTTLLVVRYRDDFGMQVYQDESRSPRYWDSNPAVDFALRYPDRHREISRTQAIIEGFAVGLDKAGL
jgi:hypothetical protein